MNRQEWIHFTKNYHDREADLLTRCYDELMNNVYDKDGYLWSPYRCVSPGKNWFKGIWNWDSAFHAIGISRWDPELAKESILGFLKFQREDGLLPDVIWENGEMVDTFSKPPVFPWAIEIVYKRNKDSEFLKEVYPKLVLNEKYWVENRCFNGLFYYDADNKESNDYLRRVKYESGWDNSPRWDNGITEYWAIDLNCFMVLFYRSMSFFAKELGLPDDFDLWNKKEKQLTKTINERMWDSENKYYADTNKITKEVSSALSPASFMPLYIGIASAEQAESMRIIAENNFKYKMPTISFDNPQYSNDYWRGPTWLNVAYFAAKGLKNYGFEVADKIKQNIIDMCYNEKSGIYENYDSVTGKGLCCDHFSWSCVFINEFILNF
jgi:putative isomerase